MTLIRHFDMTKDRIVKKTNESVDIATKALKNCTGKQVDSKSATILAVQALYISTVSGNAESLTNDAVKIAYDSLSQYCGGDISVESVAELANQVLYLLHESEKNKMDGIGLNE